MTQRQIKPSFGEGLADPTLRVNPPHDGSGAAAVQLPEALRPAAAVPRERGRDWLLHRVLLLADVFGLSLAFVIAQALFPPQGHVRDLLAPGWEALIFIMVLPVWVLIGMLSGLYGRDHTRADHSTVDDFVGVFAVVTIGSWIYSAIAWLTHAVSPNPPRMVAFWLMAIAFVVVARGLGRAVARRSPLYPQRAVILGAGEVGQLIARKLGRHPEYGIRLVGFVDGNPRELRPDLADTPLLGPPAGLLDVIRKQQIDRVIVAYSGEPDGELIGVVNGLRATSVHVDIVPRLFDAVGPRVGLHTVETLPLLGLPPVRLTPSERMAKRLIDILIVVILLVLLAPLFAYIVWRVKRDSPGPVFFRQQRLGLNMRPFTVLKFRTMRQGVDDGEHRDYISMTMSPTALAEASGLYKLAREDAVTRSGRWLRRFSLDELPQLVNVLKGEMSLVGPRPCIAYETEHFAPHHFERFLVMPGMTGLWQVAARARSSFGEALAMDVLYARGWSLALDLRLLCRTPIALIRQASNKSTA